MRQSFLVTPVKPAWSTACGLGFGTWGADGCNASSSVFAALTPGIKVERIKVIVRCPSHPPLLPSEKRVAPKPT